MSGFQRVESKFSPIPDMTGTFFMTEATFVISSQKQTPGVNFKFQVNDMDEAGNPQQGAGRSGYLSKWLSEKTVGDFCQLLDMMGFKTDDAGNYLLVDGSLMPNLFELKHDTPLPFLVGLPFVAKLTSKEETYDGKDEQGNVVPKDKTSYNMRANWITPPDGGRKVMQMSVHPSKAAAFAINAPGGQAPGQAAAAMFGGAAAFGAASAPAGVVNPAFGANPGTPGAVPTGRPTF